MHGSGLVWPLLVAFSKDDPGVAARVVRECVKKCEKLKVKAWSVEGRLLAANDLNALANLPTRDEAIAQLMSVMQAPITKFVRTLAEPHGKLVRTFAALPDKKQQTA